MRVITANPKTAGGARWNFFALWGHRAKQGDDEALSFVTRVRFSLSRSLSLSLSLFLPLYISLPLCLSLPIFLCLTHTQVHTLFFVGLGMCGLLFVGIFFR